MREKQELVDRCIDAWIVRHITVLIDICSHGKMTTVFWNVTLSIEYSVRSLPPSYKNLLPPSSYQVSTASFMVTAVRTLNFALAKLVSLIINLRFSWQWLLRFRTSRM